MQNHTVCRRYAILCLWHTSGLVHCNLPTFSPYGTNHTACRKYESNIVYLWHTSGLVHCNLPHLVPTGQTIQHAVMFQYCVPMAHMGLVHCSLPTFSPYGTNHIACRSVSILCTLWRTWGLLYCSLPTFSSHGTKSVILI